MLMPIKYIFVRMARGLAKHLFAPLEYVRDLTIK